MKFIISKVGISVVFTIFVVFSSMSAFAGCYEDGYRDGSSDGYKDGYAAGSKNDRYQEGYDDGNNAKICKVCPADRYQEGYKDGNNAKVCPPVKVCPADRYEDGYKNGQTFGTNVGKQECIDDPSSCFRKKVQDIPSSLPENYCDNKTKTCVSMTHDKLYLPNIGLDTDGNNNTYPIVQNVEMYWLRKKENKSTDKVSAPLIFAYNYQETDSVGTSTLTISELRTGQVISQPVGINCGNGEDDCVGKFISNASVNLFAVPVDSGSIFTEWGGDCQGTTNKFTVPMDKDNLECTATFTEQ
jgi:hypothetical protein